MMTKLAVITALFRDNIYLNETSSGITKQGINKPVF